MGSFVLRRRWAGINLCRPVAGVVPLLPDVRWVRVIVAASERFTLKRSAVDVTKHLANRPRPERFSWHRGSSAWSLAVVLRSSALTYLVSIGSRLSPRTPTKSAAQLNSRPTESSRHAMMPPVLRGLPPGCAGGSLRFCKLRDDAGSGLGRLAFARVIERGDDHADGSSEWQAIEGGFALFDYLRGQNHAVSQILAASSCHAVDGSRWA
jgi:hypothetical protein